MHIEILVEDSSGETLLQLAGQIKHEWAKKIGPLMDPEKNLSQSFRKFRDGLRKIVKKQQGQKQGDHQDDEIL
jgi:hypothetical protein